MELSKLQTKILNAKSNKTIVISSAASGKSRLLTEKVRQILRAGVEPRDIAVITFTNMAAAELRQRLDTDYKEGLFIGTIHALANYMLCAGGVDTSKILDDEKFDELFKLIKQHPTCIKKMEWVLLDEAQDSDRAQFTFLFDMIDPHNFFICGDPKQSIYQWRGGCPSLMLELSGRAGVKVFDMNENYRNGSNILSFAKRLIRPTGLVDTSIAMTANPGEVIEIPYSTRQILNFVVNGHEYGNWAVLTRTNQEIATVSAVLQNEKIPFDTFRQGDLSKEELNIKMKQNTVKVLTVHSAKGLEWDNVIVVGMKYYSNEERNVCYVAATRARKKLVWMTATKKNKIYEW